MRKTATMASFPPRRKAISETIDTLYDQMDEIRIYLNGYEYAPHGLEDDPKIKVYRSQKEAGDLGDVGKFYDPPDNGWHFLVDDDILYPSDYAERMIEAGERLGGIVGVHGARFDSFPVESYYEGRTVFHFSRALGTPTPVHVLGTGTTLYRAEVLAAKGVRADWTRFPLPNMADIFFAGIAAQANVPMTCVERRSGWLKNSPHYDANVSIYARREENDRAMTEIIGATDWPDLKHPADA